MLLRNAHAQTPAMTPDIPAKFTPPRIGYDFQKREAMIPMRDGVKLYTVIAIPKGTTNAPIILTRTPYDAASRLSNEGSPYLLDHLMVGDDVWGQGGVHPRLSGRARQARVGGRFCDDNAAERSAEPVRPQ
jgi:predicted acyl esterase